MEIRKWISSFKIEAFPWIDGKRIYFNVQYFAPGQSIAHPPVWDKSIFVTDNLAGRQLVYEFTDSLVNYVSMLNIARNATVVLTV